MKFYVTKYALTQGIFTFDGVVKDGYAKGMSEDGLFRYFFKFGRDAHATWDEAHTKAVEMRARNIDSLKKQLVKLELMRFTEPTPE